MKNIALVAICLPLILTACQKHSAHAGGTEVRSGVLHEAMKDVVAPQAQILWDVSNRGMNDEGAPDGSRLTDEDWAKIIAAGASLEAKATELAETKKIVVARPGETIQDQENPGASTPQQVQAFIDKDPESFSAMAQALAQSGKEFSEAAKQRDAVKLAALSGALDQVCEDCHLRYWYPQQATPQ
ncbi:hypothetical protein SCLO_1014140 [Sphingobium cloacae]|uniref:Cytochrome c n=2 Tax=Sphingobium cloacae TaxID=120107 RepID=A0A1E1F1R9_9SPHN|nr:hypothetical protein SCLO_1014140 [Sphingobium cloacae]